MHGVHLLTRPMTLGVRGAAFDAQGRIFLVRHTYIRGWYMPGGGVDAGEAAEDALLRELSEEGNLEVEARPTLIGVYCNNTQSKRDHVILYRCDGVTQHEVKTPDREIAESGFFTLDNLPDGLTDATRRRLDELAGRQPIDRYW
ncbi:NUDIX domain-containing protein [Jiella sp. MQZ9-1]|uniref:NUDIX domain-containing protein n=1 Tax=Jiella flava TaxID=2816857 RepID=A0A939FZW6_9HYPH|nr:NUDIX domain-containing protein [Jiella flava]MBO0663280.1 NUDIX domain-containing protein [Jiella flava]MCD2471856.1 NUDIX domain-containing protein [Jiella flava]